jgi:hypothetical protein
MLISKPELEALVLRIAREQFAERTFERRPLMDAAEREARRLGFWTSDDDTDSGSSSPKSKGLANIDYRFTDLRRNGLLRNVGRNQWQVPS